METVLAAAVVALIFILAKVFSGVTVKVAKHLEDEVTTSCNEAQTKLIKRSLVAYEQLVKECGEDFKTPQQIYYRMQNGKNKEEIK